MLLCASYCSRTWQDILRKDTIQTQGCDSQDFRVLAARCTPGISVCYTSDTSNAENMQEYNDWPRLLDNHGANDGQRAPGVRIQTPVLAQFSRNPNDKVTEQRNAGKYRDATLHTTSETYGPEELLGPVSKNSPVLENGAPSHHLAADLVFAFFINPIGASAINPGTQSWGQSIHISQGGQVWCLSFFINPFDPLEKFAGSVACPCSPWENTFSGGPTQAENPVNRDKRDNFFWLDRRR